MADEDNKQPKKFKGLGGEPGEDEEPIQAPDADENDGELPQLSDLVRYEVPVGKDKPAVVYTDPVTNKIKAYDVALAAKTPTDPKSGVMYVLEDGVWLTKGDSPEAEPYENEARARERATLYQNNLNIVLAKPKPVPPAEEPEDDVKFDDVDDDLEDKVDEKPKAPVKAPARAPSAAGIVVDQYRLKFNKGLFSASVTVYEGNKTVGSYTAFGGTVKGPAVDKLPQNVVDTIKETYLNGLKGK